jgi:dipeptidyl-peptidase 4
MAIAIATQAAASPSMPLVSGSPKNISIASPMNLSIADNPEAWARASDVDIADRLVGKLLLIHGGMDDQVHPDHTLRLADQLIAVDKDFEQLIVPGAEHLLIDSVHYVRKRGWDFLVRELMGTQPPAYRPARIPINPEL